MLPISIHIQKPASRCMDSLSVSLRALTNVTTDTAARTHESDQSIKCTQPLWIIHAMVRLFVTSIAA